MLHKDVLKTIYSFQLNEMLEKSMAGEHLAPEQVVEVLTTGMQATHQQYLDLFENYEKVAKTCNEYADIIIRMTKELQRERRIVQLFLINHRLEYQYDNFETRILERIFENEDRKKEATP